jgi:signal transduction histidine kinase
VFFCVNQIFSRLTVNHKQATQISWWVIVFTKYVDTVKSLRLQLSGSSEVISQFENEAFRQKVMFFSESAFFALIASVALWILFRALRTEEKSLEAQRNFLEVITHESKTPLTALKLRLESLGEKITSRSNESDLMRALELSLQEVRRLTSIIEKSLEVSRVEKQSLVHESIPLDQLIQDLVLEIEPVFKEKQVHLDLKLENGIRLVGDSWTLKNAFKNLIENSLNYNQSNEKRLSISLSKAEGKAKICVWDNGPGVPENEKPLIFEKYFRGKAGKKVPGTGLGLYLTHQIIAAHGGSIELESNPQGAKFLIYLPLGAR